MRRIAVTTPITHLEGVLELLKTKGEVFLYEEASKEEVRELLLDKNIDTIFCNPNQQTYKIDKELLDGTVVDTIDTASTGMNHIDQKYCSEVGIKVLSLTKDYDLIKQLPSTSELAFGLLLDLMRNISASNQSVKEGLEWDYLPYVGHQLKDYPVGIVGFGRLGKMMYGYLKAFGARVYVYDPYKHSEWEDAFLLNSACTSLEELFVKSKAVSLHVHVTDETKYMIDYNLVSKIDYLVNTSRGEIVIEEDIVKA